MDTALPTVRPTTQVTLDAELVSDAQRHTMNITRLIERLLREHLETERAHLPQRKAEAEEHARFTAAYIARYGRWGEEFDTF
jgi:post-segregation antitoxin (ccd killing protein)